MSDRLYLMRYARAKAKELGLTDLERQELAMVLPGQGGASGPVSWADLGIDDLRILVYWLDGAMRVYHLLALRR